MAESAVSFLLGNLSMWLQQRQQLLEGLGQEVVYIQDEMRHMKAFLKVADAKEETDPQLKEWVTQVREIAYDTEDVVDRYILKFSYHGGANGLSGHIKRFYMSIKFVKARRQIAVEIQQIKSRVQNASQSHQRYSEMYLVLDQGSSSVLSSNSWYDGLGDALLLEEADVVGIEKPRKQLLKWILSTDLGIKVISVVGMGGLGKTTLVKKVYDDEVVKATFDHHLWITVSESFSVEHLLRNMIQWLVGEVKQPTPQGLELMNADRMREFIYVFLQHKTYVIVLDDVWKIDAWEAIRYAFPRSTTNSHGRIIITTRFNSIGNATSGETNGHLYNLEPLAAEESKQLFYMKAFPGNSCPLHLKEISESILKRCEGLPLAIVVIGCLLASKNNNIEEWEMFSRSLGDELEGDSLKRMKKLISLSFYDLPYYLKSCFLYISIFAEDELLEKWRLIRLWTAEGFVQDKRGKTVEEVAEGYLNELLNRSLIQVAQKSLDGRSRQFRIHDLLREYIITKSREYNMVSMSTEGEIRWPNKIRRLAIHNSVNWPQDFRNFECLRSLLWLDFGNSDFGSILSKLLGGGCRLFKVLDLRRSPLDVIPHEVFKCYHLVYLSLRDTKIKHIPKTVKYLQNLETLDLKGSKVTELPLEIITLRRLRHLLLYSYKDPYPINFDNIESFKAPYEIGKMSSLRKLATIDADKVGEMKTVKEIGKLTELRRLGISKLRREDGKDLCSSLAKLTNLRSLNVYSIAEGETLELQELSVPGAPSLPFLRTLYLRGCLEKLPRWIPSLDGLTRLYLSWSRLMEDPLKWLQGLPNLVVLSLNCAFEGEGLSFEPGCFRRLKVLLLGRLKGLRWVKVRKGSMPQIERIEMWDCKLVDGVPEGVEHLSKLQYVEFADMSDDFFDRLYDQKINEGNDWKLAHVPKVSIFRGV